MKTELQSLMMSNCSSILDNLYGGIYIVDKDRTILYWNKAAERISGFPADEVIGSRCSDNILEHVDRSGKNLCREGCPLHATMLDGQTREAEVYLHHRSGHRIPVLVRSAPMRNDDNEIIGAVELYIENTPRENMREKIETLRALSLIDELTQLPNRRLAESELEALITYSLRHQREFGVLFMDIDHFRTFNNTYGHATGDRVLMMVAETLKNAVRGFDTVARWGGEEFVGIFPDADRPKLRDIACRLHALTRNSHLRTPDGNLTRVTLSIGGAAGRPGDTTASLLERADKLMYYSKEHGRDRVTLEDDVQADTWPNI